MRDSILALLDLAPGNPESHNRAAVLHSMHERIFGRIAEDCSVEVAVKCAS